MMNLKHDIDLQRLLKESHLLEQAKKAESGAKQRQIALDMRLQELGARESIFKQKMPTSHRQGINLKARQRESHRRKDAKENGVILEKQSVKKSSSHRVRGVDVPGVGKFKGGTLKLSRRDVASIQGPSRGKSRRRWSSFLRDCSHDIWSDSSSYLGWRRFVSNLNNPVRCETNMLRSVLILFMVSTSMLSVFCKCTFVQSNRCGTNWHLWRDRRWTSNLVYQHLIVQQH